MLNKISPAKIYFYHIITLGLYFFYWAAKSRAAVNSSAKQTLVPSTWLLAIPFANYWWMWQYARALEYVSYKRIRSTDTILFFILATNFIWLVWQVFSIFDPKWLAGHFGVMNLVLSAIVITIITVILGLGFFCAVMQGKINKIR